MIKSNNLEFRISQLRQDKIIYAIEAVAVNITCLVAGSLAPFLSKLTLIPSVYLFYSNMAIYAFGILFTFYALLGNLARLRQIKQLEAKL